MRLQRFAPLLAVPLVFAFASGSEEKTPSLNLSMTHEMLAEALLPQLGPCEKQCITCVQPAKHAILWNGSRNDWGPNHQCGGGGCEMHDCDNYMVDAGPVAIPYKDSAFWTALRDAPPDVLQRFLANNQDSAAFNADRHSIQVSGCGKVLVANLPLSERQAAGLLLGNN